MHDDRFWPKAKQLALKKLCDPDHYDLEAALNLVRVPDHTKGKAVIVTPEDVEVWVEELRNKIYTRQPLTEVEL